MTRLISHDATGPLRIAAADVHQDLYLCRCGLSRNGPYCDSSHKATRDERSDALYLYERQPDGTLLRVATPFAAPSLSSGIPIAPRGAGTATPPSPAVTTPSAGSPEQSAQPVAVEGGVA